MPAQGWTARWRQHSQSGRFELCARWSLYVLPALAVALELARALRSGAPTAVRATLVVAIVAHNALVTAASSRALRRGPDGRLLPSVAAASGALLALATVVLCAMGVLSWRSTAFALAIVPTALGATPLYAVLRSTGHLVALVVGTAVATGAMAFALGLPVRQGASAALGGLATGCGVAVAVRLTVWMLDVVRELERARQTQAALAVAEERLRFARDLHDVLGRNLSVVALKSELATQLADRDLAAALRQMTEVQRIARDSQREVRAVVRGYRETALATELAGARGVLESAGIDCEITADAGDDLPGPVRSVLAWVVREGTTNVLRHTNAANCAITLRTRDDREAVLTIHNNGAHGGAPHPSGGSGLPGLRERLARLDGRLTARQGPDGTFQLTAVVPLAGGAMGRQGGDA